MGYATGQFGKNHLGDKDEFLPTNHGFDEFFGNLYHMNAEEEPEKEPEGSDSEDLKEWFSEPKTADLFTNAKYKKRIEARIEIFICLSFQIFRTEWTYSENGHTQCHAERREVLP
jgi:arylsulfatase A-like enzyme